MMHFHVYLLATGAILRSGWCQTETFNAQAGDGEGVVAGDFDPATHIIVDGMHVWVGAPDPEAVDPVAELAALREITSVSREDFAFTVRAAGLISWPEATAWATQKSLPAIAQPLLDALPEGADRDAAEFTLLARNTIRRMAPEIVSLGASLGMAPPQIDALFGLPAA